VVPAAQPSAPSDEIVAPPDDELLDDELLELLTLPPDELLEDELELLDDELLDEDALADASDDPPPPPPHAAIKLINAMLAPSPK